jgi:hypothetical protein
MSLLQLLEFLFLLLAIVFLVVPTPKHYDTSCAFNLPIIVPNFQPQVYIYSVGKWYYGISQSVMNYIQNISRNTVYLQKHFPRTKFNTINLITYIIYSSLAVTQYI